MHGQKLRSQVTSQHTPKEIAMNKDKRTHEKGLLHSKNGQPSVIDHTLGIVQFHKKGNLHSPTGRNEQRLPAVVHHNGHCEWYDNGIRFTHYLEKYLPAAPVEGAVPDSTFTVRTEPRSRSQYEPDSTEVRTSAMRVRLSAWASSFDYRFFPNNLGLTYLTFVTFDEIELHDVKTQTKTQIFLTEKGIIGSERVRKYANHDYRRPTKIIDTEYLLGGTPEVNFVTSIRTHTLAPNKRGLANRITKHYAVDGRLLGETREWMIKFDFHRTEGDARSGIKNVWYAGSDTKFEHPEITHHKPGTNRAFYGREATEDSVVLYDDVDRSYVLYYSPSRDQYRAGCRRFTYKEAISHWCKTHVLRHQPEYIKAIKAHRTALNNSKRKAPKSEIVPVDTDKAPAKDAWAGLQGLSDQGEHA